MSASENIVLSGTRNLTGWHPDGKLSPGFDVCEVVVGRDDAQLALEIVVLDAGPDASMSREALGSFHGARLGRRVSPVVVWARRSGQAWLFGPNAQASVVGPVSVDQAQRMLQTALDEPSGLAARQRLAGMFAAIEGTKPRTETDYLPGVANSGLFATHELRNGVRRREDWPESCEKAEPLLRLRREALVEALGYTAQSVAAHALILFADGIASRAVAVLLDENESFDGDSSRFSVSPVAYAVSLAQKQRTVVGDDPAGLAASSLPSASGARGRSEGTSRDVLRDRSRARHRRVSGVPTAGVLCARAVGEGFDSRDSRLERPVRGCSRRTAARPGVRADRAASRARDRTSASSTRIST